MYQSARTDFTLFAFEKWFGIIYFLLQYLAVDSSALSIDVYFTSFWSSGSI